MVLDTGLEIRFGLWYLTLLSTLLQLYRTGHETGVPGENQLTFFVV